MSLGHLRLYLFSGISAIITLVTLSVYLVGSMNARTYDQFLAGRIVNLTLLLIPGAAFLSGFILLHYRSALFTYLASWAVGFTASLLILSVVPSPLWQVYDYLSSPNCQAGTPLAGASRLCTSAATAFYVTNFTIGVAIFSMLFGIVCSALGCYTGLWRQDRIDSRKRAPMEPFSGLSGVPLNLPPSSSDPKRQQAFNEYLERNRQDKE